MGNWQPIETAPETIQAKENEVIVLWCDASLSILTHCKRKEGVWQQRDICGVYWPLEYYEVPTHWMRITAPIEEQEAPRG